MRTPLGESLLRWSRGWLDEATVTNVIEPMVADARHEPLPAKRVTRAWRLVRWRLSFLTTFALSVGRQFPRPIRGAAVRGMSSPLAVLRRRRVDTRRHRLGLVAPTRRCAHLGGVVGAGYPPSRSHLRADLRPWRAHVLAPARGFPGAGIPAVPWRAEARRHGDDMTTDRLLAIAEWWCGADARARIFEPLVADWAARWRDALNASAVRRLRVIRNGGLPFVTPIGVSAAPQIVALPPAAAKADDASLAEHAADRRRRRTAPQPAALIRSSSGRAASVAEPRQGRGAVRARRDNEEVVELGVWDGHRLRDA